MTNKLASPPRRRFARNRTARILCAVCLGLLPFVLIEIVLRLTGFGTPTGYHDPFVGFSQAFPLFELNSASDEYVTSRHHHYFFGKQRFSATKSPDGFRCFCLGGSTVLGHPYETESAFPRWLELELAGADPPRGYEFINCGGMSYASYRLIPILEEVLRHDPDLILVMTGHNEFLEDRTYHSLKERSAVRRWVDDTFSSLHTVTAVRHAVGSFRSQPDGSADDRTILSQDVDARLDHSSGYGSYRRDEQWTHDVQQHFALNLRVMVRMCRDAGVPIVLINPGSNLRDCPPFKSEHRSGLTSQQLAEWTDYFEKGTTIEVDYPEESLKQYRLAAAIDDQHAQLVYRIARCLDRLEQTEEARDAYVRAKELDVCPLRIRNSMQQRLLEIAKETSIPLIDAAELLASRSSDRIPGYDWYVDHVHPSIRGHQLIAQALATRLRDARLVAYRESWSTTARRRGYRDQMTKLGDRYLAAGRRRVEWLENWARRDRLRDDIVPVGARGVRNLANSYIEFAEYSSAEVAYETALSVDPDAAPEVLHRAVQMFRSGRIEAAERIAHVVLRSTSEEATADLAHVALAICAWDDGRPDVAERHARAARKGAFDRSGSVAEWFDEVPHAQALFESTTGE